MPRRHRSHAKRKRRSPQTLGVRTLEDEHVRPHPLGVLAALAPLLDLVTGRRRDIITTAPSSLVGLEPAVGIEPTTCC
jgi:hypothetical protein